MSTTTAENITVVSDVPVAVEVKAPKPKKSKKKVPAAADTAAPSSTDGGAAASAATAAAASSSDEEARPKGYDSLTLYNRKIFKEKGSDAVLSGAMWASLDDKVKLLVQRYTEAAATIAGAMPRKTINYVELRVNAQNKFRDASKADTSALAFAETAVKKYLGHKDVLIGNKRKRLEEEKKANGGVETKPKDGVKKKKLAAAKPISKAAMAELLMPPPRVKTLMLSHTTSHVADATPVFVAALAQAFVAEVVAALPGEKITEEKLLQTVDGLGWGIKFD